MKKERCKKIFFALRILICASILILGVVIWRTIGTESGRLYAANLILDRIQSGKNPAFVIENLTWPKLRIIAANKVTIFDDQGPWLEIEQANATIGLRALLSRNLLVNSLSAQHVRMARLPSYTRKNSAPNKKSPGWSFVLNQIEVGDVETGNDLLPFPIRSTLRAEANVQPDGSGFCNIINGSVVIRGEQAEFTVNLSWNRREFLVENMITTLRGAKISGNGSYIFSTHAAEARIESEKIDLPWLSGMFNRDVGGQAGADFIIKRINDVTSINWEAHGTGITYAAIQVPSIATRGEAEYNTTQSWHFTFSADAAKILVGERDIDHVSISGFSQSNRLELTSELTLHQPLDITLTNHLAITHDASSITARLLELSGSVDQRNFTLNAPSQLSWTSSDQWMLSAGPLSWNGTSIKLSVKKDSGISGRGYIRSFNLGEIPELKKRGYNGLFYADWDIRHFPSRAEGNINVRVSDMETGDQRFAHLLPESIRASATVDNSGVIINGQTHDSSNFSAIVRATLPCVWSSSSPWITLDDEKESRVILQAKTELKFLSEQFLPDWQHLSGNVFASVQASGSITNPLITGSVSITNGFFEDVVRGAIVRDIQIMAESMHESAYRIEASARDDHKGTMSMTGTYKRNGHENYFLQASAGVSNFIVGRLFSTEIPISGQLVMEGTGAIATLRGTMNVPALTIRLPPQLPPSIRNITLIDPKNMPPSLSPTNGSRTKSFPMVIDTDIRIDAGSGVRINGKQLRSEWRGRGQINGQIPDVRFGGNVGIVRGSFMFLGRRFTILRGEVIIPAGKSANPTVFITAETRAGGANIQLRVEGSTSEPLLSLTSDPPLEKNEIVSRLLFGKSSESVTPFQIAYLAYALDLLEGGGPLLQQLDSGESILGLDQLDIKQSEEESGLSSVMFGKRLHDRLYLEGEVGLKDEPDVLAIETELTPSLILRTESSPRIREGISINWRKDY